MGILIKIILISVGEKAHDTLAAGFEWEETLTEPNDMKTYKTLMFDRGHWWLNCVDDLSTRSA